MTTITQHFPVGLMVHVYIVDVSQRDRTFYKFIKFVVRILIILLSANIICGYGFNVFGNVKTN